MEHDRKCEFGKHLARYVKLGFFMPEEVQVIRDHQLCLCGVRRTGVLVTERDVGKIVERWMLVRDNYRDKMVQEHRSKLGGWVEDVEERDEVATVISLKDFRKRKLSEGRDDASD